MTSGEHEPAPVPEVVDDPEVFPPRPGEAAPETAPRRPLALIWTYIVGFAMGAADVVPAFSGGTVALVAGVYERLVANLRQGAHVLSLLLRGNPEAARQAFIAIEWPFVASLLTGILTALLVVSATLRELLDRFPTPMSAIFLGLILGAAAVAQRELRRPAFYHALIAIGVGVLVFVGLGWSPGAIEEPNLLFVFAAVAVAACAMILPGVSGAFLLLMLGMYDAVFPEGFGTRNLPVMLAAVLGAATGLALFSTALNYLLRRWHDLILAVLLGVMLGSARVLWPWPDGMRSAELVMPEGNEGLLAFSLALAAFAVIWLVGLVIPGTKDAERRAAAKAAKRAAAAEPPAMGHTAPPHGTFVDGTTIEGRGVVDRRRQNLDLGGLPDRRRPQPQPGEPAEAGPAEPGLAEPGPAEPGLAEPGLAEPGLAEPGRHEPPRPEPERRDPARTDPDRRDVR